MSARYLEVNLKRDGGEQRRGYLERSGVEEFVQELGADVNPEQIYMIERVNCNKTVHFLIKHGDKSREDTRRYILDRYRSGKLVWLDRIRDKVKTERKVAV
ncbi:hypothetical protein [Sporohalobacter salinus]|uniref:hypothetical protein n=1 Tax=Sporohalobacter salinus TaxID=1494606 RepID=UPI00195FA487|nr:hypothetical protein [Sporohalobacter salinus]MBM7624758.1 hypothetical protein [Sporohalobacter salinus]